MPTHRPKLIGFDMNKTLIERGASWYDFNLSMGITPQEDEGLYRRGPEMSGELDYHGWLQELERLIIERGKGSIDRIESVLRTYQLHPEAKAAINLIHQSGNLAAIVTSGFEITAKKVAAQLGVKYVVFGTSLRFDELGMLEQIISPPHDEQFKASALIHLAADNSIGLENTFYIADGDNDAATFKKVHGIIIKPSTASIEDWKIKALSRGEQFSAERAAEHAYIASSLLDATKYALSY